MSEDKLKALRSQIDKIDAELVPLFCKRMDTALKVALYKKENDIPIFDAEREKAIIESLAGSAGKYKGYASVLYGTLMDLSRALQHDVIYSVPTDSNKETIQFDASLPCRVACFGREGAYAHIAACNMFKSAEIEFFPTFSDTAAALLNGTNFDYAVMPVENSTAGSVLEVYDILINNPLYIVAGIEIPVIHCLLGVSGSTEDTVKTVYSHKQALSQCSEFIKAHGMQQIEELSTASAAFMVSKENDISIGAIASKMAASKYGLNIIKEGIQNTSNNSTRFVALSRRLSSSRDADKISIVFSLDHQPGTLYRTLARFAALGLNLTKIESRPKHDGKFEYMFYLDFTGNIHRDETGRLLSALKSEMQDFKVLGNYKDSHMSKDLK